MSRKRSEYLFQRAQELMPGGVNSPVRAFLSVGGSPVFFESGDGAYLTDVDGNKYLDYVASWGPMLRGFNYVPTIEALSQQLNRTTSFGAPSIQEIELAELVIDYVPSIEKVRMVNSGTEATMSAIRLARGVTGRDKIVKFEGCFHGHGDSLLVKAGSGVMTLGLPDSPGVPADLAMHTITLPFNDPSAVERVFDQRGNEIACVIVEPIAGNMGCIPPAPGYLKTLKECTSQSGTLLIFDEVMTGFRVTRGGAQELYGVHPDLTTLGKILGGGLPVGALGGSAELMDQLAPNGPVYQSGTLSGNPLAMAAGAALLQSLDDELYSQLATTTQTLTQGIRDTADLACVDVVVLEVCGMFSIHFTDQETIQSYHDAANCDTQKYRQFFHLMLDHNVYFAPSAFECAFVSSCHGPEEVQVTLDAIADSFKQIR